MGADLKEDMLLGRPAREPSARQLVVTPNGGAVGYLVFALDEDRAAVVHLFTLAGERIVLPLDKITVRRNRFILNVDDKGTRAVLAKWRSRPLTLNDNVNMSHYVGVRHR